jgi:hypothetical protein
METTTTKSVPAVTKFYVRSSDNTKAKDTDQLAYKTLEKAS